MADPFLPVPPSTNGEPAPSPEDPDPFDSDSEGPDVLPDAEGTAEDEGELDVHDRPAPPLRRPTPGDRLSPEELERDENA